MKRFYGVVLLLVIEFLLVLFGAQLISNHLLSTANAHEAFWLGVFVVLILVLPTTVWLFHRMLDYHLDD